VTRDDVRRWLHNYVEAWRTYDPEAIAALFTEDAEYRYHPYDEPVRGRDAIVASWLEEDRRDEPGTWKAGYDVFALDGNVAVATGTSTYLTPAGELDRMYCNNFVLEFADDGRCKSFTEYYVQKPGSGNP
jgi:uncharacterized protein (TIGR02246 family)